MGNNTVGIILAGGKGTRLGELVRSNNKHLLPVGKYPMIYYPLYKMVETGIKDILIVTGPEHTGNFINLLGSGSKFNVNLTYRVQDEAGGIAQALGLAERFCCGNRCLVILGDNIFEQNLSELIENQEDAWVMLKKVEDPQRYGVADLDKEGNLLNIEEKPKEPKSNMAVTGVYLYPYDVFEIIKTLKPSKRGELEITDVNNHYLKENRLKYIVSEGFWSDAGTFESLKLANLNTFEIF